MTLLNLAAWLFVIVVVGVVALYLLKVALELTVAIAGGTSRVVRWVVRPDGMRQGWKESPLRMTFFALLFASAVFILAY